MKNIKLFIWDFDGTLLDTYPFTTACLRNALLDFGYDVSQTDILEKMMVNIPHAINYYADLYQLPDLRAHIKNTMLPRQMNLCAFFLTYPRY